MKLRTGRTAVDALRQLTEVRNQLGSYTGPTGDAAVQALNYAKWVSSVEANLQNLFADTDVLDGLLSERYWRMLTFSPYVAAWQIMYDDEIKWQKSRLEDAIATLSRWQALGQREGELLVLDTNTLLECRPYNEIPWRQILTTKPKKVRLVLTFPVIHELEKIKRGQYSDDRRNRARDRLPMIDRMFGDGEAEWVPVAKDGKEIPGVTVEILRDEPGLFQPTSDVDEAILDRAEFLQQATARPVTMVTGDISMKLHTRVRPENLNRISVPEKYQLKNRTPKPRQDGVADTPSETPRADGPEIHPETEG